MRYRKTDKWKDCAASSNLLYFAQLLDELLFDFSLDTYKPSAMNSSLLCIEALDAHYEIEQGNIKRPNFQHIIDELFLNLQKDRVAASLLQIKLDSIAPVLKDPKADFHEKRVVIELLARQLELKKYKETNSQLLIKTITSAEATRSEIRELSRSYITCLINLGYSSKYLENKTLDFFYYGENQISGNEDIQSFLDLFPSEKKEYYVIYRGAEKLSKLKESLNSLGFKVCKRAAEVEFDITQQDFPLDNHQIYISIDNIKAVDEIEAHTLATRRGELLNTLYSLFHHKERLEPLQSSLIIEKSSKTIIASKKITSAMHKCSDLTPERAATKLNKLISEFSLHKLSFKKFTRAAELHALALASDSVENQMINLWIALESIIPSKSEDKEISNIEHIISSLLPFLSIGYVDRLVAKLTRDISNWNSFLLRKTLKPIQADNLTTKMVELMALDEHKPSARNFAENFRDFHLLSDRFQYFCDLLSSPKNLHELLKRHNQRLEWQIRRIYRARNLIVHSGKTPSYTQILIENTHDYLDIVMGVLMKLAVHPKHISSIEQGFMHVNLTYTAMQKWLADKNSKFDKETISYISGRRVL